MTEKIQVQTDGDTPPQGKKPKQKKRRFMALCILAVVLVAGIVSVVLSPLGALFRMDRWLLSIAGDPIINRYRQTECISGSLIFTTTSIYTTEDIYEVIPLFLYRDGLVWKAAQFKDNSEYIVRAHLFSNTEPFLVNESFVQRLGAYTIIGIGSSQIERNELAPEDVYDNLGTTPIILSHENVGMDVEQGKWMVYFQFPGTDMITWNRTTNLSHYNWLYVIKDMSEDYEMHCGDMVIDKAYIDDLFSE